VEVPRAKTIIVCFLDTKGRRQERKLENLEARIVQHEVDHLDGVLIVDYQDTPQ
jgi:peptide deformylase